MTREEAIAYFDQNVEIMEQPPIHLGSAVAIEEWAKRCDHLSGAYRWAIAALREQEERSKAESEGRVIMLPCKVGDTVYQLRNKKHARGLGISPRIVSSACVWTDGSYALCHQGMTYCQSRDLGKTWFLTQGEAEEALRRLEDT